MDTLAIALSITVIKVSHLNVQFLRQYALIADQPRSIAVYINTSSQWRGNGSLDFKEDMLNEIGRTIQLWMKLGKEKDKVAMFSNQFGESALLSLKVRLRIKHAATAAISSGVSLGIFYKRPSTLSTNSNPVVLDKPIQVALFQHTLHPCGNCHVSTSRCQ